MTNLDRERLGMEAADLARELRRVPDEDHGSAEFADGGDRAFHHDGGTMIPSHGVDGDLQLGAFDGEDLPALVVTTVGAHAMRLLGLPTLRTNGRRGRRQLVVGAALAPACLRVAPFWKRHRGPLFA
jgi:hypothetical protein